MIYKIIIKLPPIIFQMEVDSNEFIFQTIESIRKRKHISPSLPCILTVNGFILPMFKKWGELGLQKDIQIKLVSYNKSGANLIPIFSKLAESLRKERDQFIQNSEPDLKQSNDISFLNNLLEENRIDSKIYVTDQLRWDLPSIHVKNGVVLGINLRNCNITKIRAAPHPPL